MEIQWRSVASQLFAGVFGIFFSVEAAAQGIEVNGNCLAGSCPPPLLSNNNTELLPYLFNFTSQSGDIFQFFGTAFVSTTTTPQSFGNSYVITYLGNGGGSTPSAADTLVLDTLANFSTPNLPTSSILNVNGSFGAGIAASSSAEFYGTYNGTRSATLGPFSPPKPYSASTSNAVPASGTGLDDITRTHVFGGGSVVGSTQTYGSQNLASAVLPESRSVEVGNTATVFATVINFGTSSLSNCEIVLPPSASGLSLLYQTTNPQTNVLTGTANTPVTIAAGASQTFVLAFTTTAPFSAQPLAPFFACAGTIPAAITLGVNTLDLLFSASPVADIVALVGTPTNDGALHLPGASGSGAFAVATVNLGIAATITASVNTGSTSLPLALTICQTNPTSGQCLSPPAASATATIAANATPTFAIFGTATAAIPFLPGTNRIFVDFTDAGGVLHGATSVAVTTN